MDYDPARVSYDELLNVFWESHSPTKKAWTRQYRPVIFFMNSEQKRLAGESKLRTARRLGADIQTEILPLEAFYRAEDYHQKYKLQKNKTLMTLLTEIYPRMKALVDSTAAAKLNGYLNGHISYEKLTKELEALDLSSENVRRLLQGAK